MSKERNKIIPASYLVLMKDDKILMLRRFNTGYEDGSYSLVAGHVDAGESFTQAMIHEAKEEANVDIDPDDLEMVHVLNRRERVDIYFKARSWKGEIKNMEPEKCDDLNWFSFDNIPENTISCVAQALDCIKKGIFYSEFGF